METENNITVPTQKNSIRHENQVIAGWNIWAVVSVNIEKYIIITTTKSKRNLCKIRIVVKSRTQNI